MKSGWQPLALIAAVTAITIAVTVTFPITDPDLWQHLTTGRYIWQTHSVPHTQIWTWPTYGAPDTFPSWLFRAVLWPFWSVLGTNGLYLFKWLTTLAAFSVLVLAARRMGARGATPFVVAAFAALTWRQRSMARPEMLATLFLAAEIALLEARRLGDRGRLPWIALTLWLWIQCHVTFVYGLAVLAAYFTADLPALRAQDTRRRAFDLPLAGLAALVAGIVNPLGLSLLTQPLQYFAQRGDLVMRTITELKPPVWADQIRNGLPLLVAGWPLLALARGMRRGWDPVEWILCALFTYAGLSAQRFLGFYVMIAVPFVARDLVDVFRPRPAKKTPAAAPALSWRAAAFAAVLVVALSIPEWLRPTSPVKIELDTRGFPVQAASFMTEHGIRGRGFNTFDQGGYLLWRFFPERERLPFTDVHQAGTAEIRDRYAHAVFDRRAWDGLDRDYRFDYVVLKRMPPPGDSLLEFLDTSPDFAPVFLDDDAALYVRRLGPLAGIADSFAYRLLAGGGPGLQRLGAAVAADSGLRAPVRAELQRSAQSSPRQVRALTLLANLAILEADWAEARRLLFEVVAMDPQANGAWQRLGIVAEQTGEHDLARRYYERERRNQAR